MTADVPAEIAAAFERHEEYRQDGSKFTLSTTAFEGTVQVRSTGDTPTYTVTVHVPSLASVTVEEVGEAVVSGWLDTLERRLEDAPKATRTVVELDGFEVEPVGEDVRIEYTFSYRDPEMAADIAKTFVEYVEGTYVEGVIPGYEYESPVADLLSAASQGDDYGTPL